MTSTTTRRPRAPMTPIDEAETERRPRYLNTYTRSRRTDALVRRTTSDEIWQTRSACGLWQYERTETPGTPWLVTYRPTGQDVLFTTLDDGRRWTARDGGERAIAFLRAEAQRVIDRKGDDGRILMFTPGTPESVRAETRAMAAAAAAERFGRARRWAGVLDGLVLADEPDARCTGRGCCGYLTAAVAGDRAAWVHADACRECVDEQPEKRRECRELHRHVPCGDADPVLCDHARCTTAALPVLDGGQCPRGLDACCGCCEHDE